MNKLAQELQTIIDDKHAWDERDSVEKAADIFFKRIKESLIEQAKCGIEIRNMRYIVRVSEEISETASAFSDAGRDPEDVTFEELREFQNKTAHMLREEGLLASLVSDDKRDTSYLTFKKIDQTKGA